MDSSAFSWISDVKSVFGDQCDFLGSLDDEVAAIIGEAAADFETTCGFSYENNNFNLHSSSPTTDYLVDNPIIISSSRSSMPNDDFPAGLDPNINLKFPEMANSPGQLQQVKELSTKKTRRARPASQTYDHIVAERKRREQLSQRFVILSTIVPGLKKMDKTSILGDAVKYLKHLQKRVNTLEEQAKKKQTMEPVVVVRKSQIVRADEDVSSSSSEQPLPVIKARVCSDRLMKIMIHCEKNRGVLVNYLSKIERLNLVVVSTNVVTFAGFVLDVTITAQMEEEFNLTAKEVEKQLRASLYS